MSQIKFTPMLTIDTGKTRGRRFSSQRTPITVKLSGDVRTLQHTAEALTRVPAGFGFSVAIDKATADRYGLTVSSGRNGIEITDQFLADLAGVVGQLERMP